VSFAKSDAVGVHARQRYREFAVSFGSLAARLGTMKGLRSRQSPLRHGQLSTTRIAAPKPKRDVYLGDNQEFRSLTSVASGRLLSADLSS